ncbi:phosphate/phosphite/phosphonate ABC transporter substrate-binding protein [Desulfopila sp. IMCC35006]|uniref:phosphate/phosphite/phosphonate ABC transporter substrate-binding protein n=1 Tax=Desulfopila sp. IMCC35006 TaxID=2569542 RepID=UPI0010AC8CC2|nr:PhnD/SsuA/transferrin family substrate-binding protein [Desulfopila sp. IMCC35006]TKB25525.1 phosphate/phosphite/phosphonate ABC transporter substrate-binding protein [Desulfopila sp. IMCC35006]
MHLKERIIAYLITLAVLSGLGWCTSLGAATAPGDVPVRHNRYVYGYSAQLFYNVNQKDLTGLLKVFTRLTERKMKDPGETSLVVYDRVSDMEKALARNEVDILIMIPEDFVSLRAQYQLDPILSADYGDHFYNEILLLVRKDSGITDVGKLRGKSLLVDVGQQGTIPMKWLDSLLATRISSYAKGFFGNIREHAKSNQVITQVFFGKTDACLVSRNSFELSAELNPQLKNKLHILEKSPGFVTGIIAARKGLKKSTRDDIAKILAEMYTDPKGKQIMTLFRINRLVPCLPEHLISVEKLIYEHSTKNYFSAQR